MYRGTFWLPGGLPDWGAFLFLTSVKGLGLDISKSPATQRALLNALPEVALTPIRHLRGKHLQAPDFDRLLNDDHVRDVLRWMQSPGETKNHMGSSKWKAFRNSCLEDLRFDPEKEDPLIAAQHMALGTAGWGKVWRRFEESPANFAEIPAILRGARPPDKLGVAPDRWPDVNESEESELHDSLEDCLKLSPHEACERVLELDERHGSRRSYVWAKLGLSPQAVLLEHFAKVAGTCLQPLGAASPKEVEAVYVERGWQGDAAALRVLAEAPTRGIDFVSRIVRHLQSSWLDESARAFQNMVEDIGLPVRGGPVEVLPGGCIIFVDGLRYDVGQLLAERLEGRGCRVSVRTRWAALPTVTATGKPAVTPAAGDIMGASLGEDFAPITAEGRMLTTPVLRQAIAAHGYQVFDAGSVDAPSSLEARGWLEAGDIDQVGHEFGARLCRQLYEELDRLVERIFRLFELGWMNVRIVTDHGWIMVPGGTPKVDLPKHLTLSRWARCATLSGTGSGDALRIPWHWNKAEGFASAPGIATFNKSEEYTHGGLSVQECLTPEILVERPASEGPRAEITSVTWRSLRCYVECSRGGAGLQADLRADSPRGKSVSAAPKPVPPDGSVSLILVDPEDAGKRLFLVLTDSEGNTVSYRETKVGVST